MKNFLLKLRKFIKKKAMNELTKHDTYIIESIKKKFAGNKKEISIRIMQYFQAKAEVEEFLQKK